MDTYLNNGISKSHLGFIQNLTKPDEHTSYSCTCSKNFETTNKHRKTKFLGSLSSKSNIQIKKNTEDCNGSNDKSTQIETNLKNIYDAYILEGLLNTSKSNHKIYTKFKQTNNLDDKQSLSDVKEILLMTNDKLDLILSTLIYKKGKALHKSKEPRTKFKASKKPAVNKQRKEVERLKNFSQFLQTTNNTSGTPNFPHLSHKKLQYIDSLMNPRLREPNCFITNPFFIPSNNTYSYFNPFMRTNYLNGFGKKSSSIDMGNTLWDPLIFMAYNLNINTFNKGNNRNKYQCLTNCTHRSTVEMESISYNLEEEKKECDGTEKT